MKSDKETRRKALKTLAVATPVVWAKPVVDSVMLPAHAELSVACETYSSTQSGDITITCCIQALVEVSNDETHKSHQILSEFPLKIEL